MDSEEGGRLLTEDVALLSHSFWESRVVSPPKPGASNLSWRTPIMGLLSKLKSVLGFGGKPTSAPSSKEHKSTRGGTPSQGHRKGQGPVRSRSAKPRGAKPEGGEGHRSSRAEGEQRHDRKDRPRHEHRGDKRQHENRQHDKRHDRKDRPPRQERPRRESHDRTERRDTPMGMKRPGGAFTAEQLKAYAEAHAAWDPASYQIPEAEGKKRFVDFGLPNEILHAVADLGFEYCTPIQAQSLEYSLAGKNLAGRAQTGTGKTAAFLIAVLTRYLRTPEKRNLKPGVPRALILAPTRELVIQICKDAEALGKYCGDVRSLAVYGGMDYDRQRRELEDAPVDLLVATPGRLKDYMRNHIVDLRQVDTLVIDEADRMLDMGFIPDVRAIVNRLPDRDHRCTMLYSATLNETVMNLAAMWMRDPVRVEIESDSLATDTVQQIVYIARAEEKFKLLFNHLSKYPEARTIIFCNRKFTTERICENLRRRGIDCEVLSGDVNQVKRLKILEAFRAGSVRTVVATDVAGRGLHVDDISFVVNYDFPYEPEDYVHRIGRTGRAGHTGTAISFADEDESFSIPDIEAYINEPLKCIMPEEWMFAELPDPKPRNRKRSRDEKPAQPANAPVAEAPATEAMPATATTEAPSETVTVVEAPAEEAKVEAPAVEVAEPQPAETAPEATPEVAPTVEAPAEAQPEVTTEAAPEAKVEATPETTPEASAKAEVKPEVNKPRPNSAHVHRPSKQGEGKPEPKGKDVRPAREPRFRPHGQHAKQDPKPQHTHRGPRRDKPVAQRWARTQAEGPRDGSESHHAQPISNRPIYTPGTRGPITDEWTPGQ